MSNLLLWLVLPLLFAPFLARRERIGAASGQLIIAGFGLAAFHQGAATLDAAELRTIAAQSPHDAWFVGITAGAMLTGACLLPNIRTWRVLVLGAPLATALAWLSMASPLPVLIGGAIGAMPSALGPLIGPTPTPTATGADARRRSSLPLALLLPLMAALVHLATVDALPDVTVHWQPLLSTAGVFAALVAATRRRWDGTAIALLLLAATRPGVLPLVAGVLFGLCPLTRRYLASGRLRLAGAGVLLMLLLTVLLRDQVLLSVILSFGLATLANRRDRVHL